MSNIVSIVNGQALTTSLAIAEGVGGAHKSVIQLIRQNTSDLEEFGGVAFEMQPFETAGGTQNREYALLNEQQSTLLMTYMRNNDVVREFKKRLVKAFYELAKNQSQNKNSIPQVSNPQTQAIIHTLVRLDEVEERQQVLQQQNFAIAEQSQILQDRVEQVELQHRNGVPSGYLSKGDAYSLYGIGLSEDIFHAALKHLKIERINYIHTNKDGFTVPTYAYRNNGSIRPAIDMFLDDAVQVSKCFCESQILKGKRFRFNKEKTA